MLLVTIFCMYFMFYLTMIVLFEYNSMKIFALCVFTGVEFMLLYYHIKSKYYLLNRKIENVQSFNQIS